MATSLSLENDSSLAKGYIKVNGTTAVTLSAGAIDTPQAKIGSLNGLLKATSGVVSQAVAGDDFASATQGAKAWVNFDGTGSIDTTATLQADYNVSSVVKTDSGKYTINFTTPLPNSNYAVAGMAGDGTAYQCCVQYGSSPRTTSSVKIVVTTQSSIGTPLFTNQSYVSVIVV